MTISNKNKKVVEVVDKNFSKSAKYITRADVITKYGDPEQARHGAESLYFINRTSYPINVLGKATPSKVINPSTVMVHDNTFTILVRNRYNKGCQLGEHQPTDISEGAKSDFYAKIQAYISEAEVINDFNNSPQIDTYVEYQFKIDELLAMPILQTNIQVVIQPFTANMTKHDLLPYPNTDNRNPYAGVGVRVDIINIAHRTSDKTNYFWKDLTDKVIEIKPVETIDFELRTLPTGLYFKTQDDDGNPKYEAITNERMLSIGICNTRDEAIVASERIHKLHESDISKLKNEYDVRTVALEANITSLKEKNESLTDTIATNGKLYELRKEQYKSEAVGKIEILKLEHKKLKDKRDEEDAIAAAKVKDREQQYALDRTVQKDYYEQRSYQRKDGSEIMKAVVPIGLLLFTAFRGLG